MDIDHRRFSVTLQPTQLCDSVQRCLRAGELNEAKMLTLFRIVADELNRSDPVNNVHMWNHIKARTERYFTERNKTKRGRYKSRS